MRRRRPSARSLTCLDTGRQGFGSRWCANRCGQLHAGGQIGTGFSQEKTLARMYRGLEIGEKFDSTGRNHENRECPSQEWACGAAGSALPWHGRGHRFDPGQVHQYILQKKQCNAKVSVKAGFFYVHRSGLAALLREVRSNWGVGSTGWIANVAERQGFEPWIPCGIHAFQACAFSHSAICPLERGATL